MSTDETQVQGSPGEASRDPQGASGLPPDDDEAWYDRSRSAAPRLATIVSVYHALILIGALVATTFYLEPSSLVSCPTAGDANISQVSPASNCRPVHWRVVTFAFMFGTLGSTLAASRYVVFAVRHSVYDLRRVPWQLLSPLHGGVLSVIAVYVVFGGLLAIARSPNPSEEYGFFVGGFAFIVGFSSELFVKRLIRATEALFGEEPNIDVIGDRHGPGASSRDKSTDREKRS